MILDLTGYITGVAQDGATEKTIAAYNRALERVGIKEVDTDKLPELYKQLLEKLKAGLSYVYVKHFLAIVFAYYRDHFDEPPFRGITYKELYRELKRREKGREAYDDSEIKKLFTAANKIDDGKNAWRAVALCLYSGLRIGGCQNIAWDSVTPVAGTDCVTFRVKSKGKEYGGILSKAVFDILQRYRDPTHKQNAGPHIVNYYPDKRKTPFDKLYRARLMRAVSTYCPEIISRIETTGDGKEVEHRKSPYHSLRKVFAKKLNAAGVPDQDLRYLMNHTPVGVTFSHYIFTEKGKQPVDLVKRMALAYQKVDEFMNPTLIYGLEPKRAIDQFKTAEVAVQ
jgi:integrase